MADARNDLVIESLELHGQLVCRDLLVAVTPDERRLISYGHATTQCCDIDEAHVHRDIAYLRASCASDEYIDVIRERSTHAIAVTHWERGDQ